MLFEGLRPHFSRLNSPFAFLGFGCYNFAKKNKRLLAVYDGVYVIELSVMIVV